jgi:hypothetical protein
MSARPVGARLGCHLTSLFNNTFDNTAVPVADPVQPPTVAKKHGWLPLLTVLFLISYGLMTMLIVEQGQTIESQRVLIRELFRDSRELSAVRQAQLASNASEGQVRSQVPSDKMPSIQTPSTQAPSTQAQSTRIPATQTPSSQAAPQHQSQKQNQKPQFQMPSRPASDVMDENRSLITI